ncbi:hypothetical protein [Streptomyces sp. NBC_01408]|uniref:hypothetical protein n=1 Tax=Streptomyces sp. NBC_01408 TaxID=2903855 RepID=UPI002257146C|nr:hypothetical protein [Streptomyces sp. NBC_01408]MCX4696136.1 hypothetical protein [Streptomyces sp. NBC_01408]
MLTDRDERALLSAAEDRIAEPLRIGAALASVRRALWARSRWSRGSAEERESVACRPTPVRQ